MNDDIDDIRVFVTLIVTFFYKNLNFEGLHFMIKKNFEHKTFYFILSFVHIILYHSLYD